MRRTQISLDPWPCNKSLYVLSTTRQNVSPECLNSLELIVKEEASVMKR